MSTDGEALRRHTQTLTEMFERGDAMAKLLVEMANHDENDFGPWTQGMHNRVSTAVQLWRATVGRSLP